MPSEAHELYPVPHLEQRYFRTKLYSNSGGCCVSGRETLSRSVATSMVDVLNAVLSISFRGLALQDRWYPANGRRFWESAVEQTMEFGDAATSQIA
jgi:hypothetical protein